MDSSVFELFGLSQNTSGGETMGLPIATSLPAAEDKLALRLEEQYQKEPAEQQYLIDVTAGVPVAVPLLTHPDLTK